ncbi:L domain-like protein [Rhizoclosmatium globosum]|uniref:L domain-like protein n=1 Tax=Rhizoclosmatium globosum TaxID=329046 RepID=A0A1Y2C1L6_9FUNG|nr:L domain-like protein [Rhizoclosmatium globosum]|eukprot:ORY40932.1 L domain-like protein [Rhizoclosmatium globosum]
MARKPRHPRVPTQPITSSRPSYPALLDVPCLPPGYFQSLPPELLQLFFAWIKPSTVLKYRRLSSRFDSLLMHPTFASQNIDLFGRNSAVNDGTLNDILYNSIDIWTNRTGTYFDTLLSLITKIRWSKSYACPSLLPNQLGGATLLTHLQISCFRLYGSLPTSIFHLIRLESLTLNTNDLSGSIPAEIGLLSNLVQLDLNNNKFTGYIPAELGNLSMLEVLCLGNNELEGPLPSEFGNLRALTDLYAESNRLSGTIPDTFGNLEMLSYMVIGSNCLSGTVPESLLQLQYIQFIDFSNNPDLSCEFISEHPEFPLKM